MWFGCIVLLVFLASPLLHADSSTLPAQKKEDVQFAKEAARKSPSFQLKKWTGTQAAYETSVEYAYLGDADHNLGNGSNGKIHEHFLEVRHQVMRRTLLAFLVQGGLEYQHQGFSVPNDAFIPDRLDMLGGEVAIDTRWSEKDLLHIAAHPGVYTDFRGSGWNAFNTPIDIGYTRVTSKRFQWILGFNYNGWRNSPFLGSGGFRWQMSDRWKLKMYMPQPAIEYTARPDMHLSFRADLRGDSYRVGPHFGDSKGHPELNSALLDYQEVRVGPNVSWNIKPLLALDVMTGWLVGRRYDFHNNGVVLNGSGAPFVNVRLLWLMKLPGEPLRIPQRNRISFRDVFKYF